MGSDRLNKDLKRLHQHCSSDVRHQQALEDDLLLRYRKTHSNKQRWINMLNPHKPLARFAFFSLAMLLLGVGACSETTTEVEVGKQVSISLPSGGATFDKSVDIEAQVRELITDLSTIAGVEDFNVNINETISDNETIMDLNIVLFGDSLDSDALISMIHNNYPDLADAEISVENLQGTITENWVERVGRQVFDIETDGATDEEIQAQVLQQLAEQGFEGDAEVNVSTRDGEQTIEIKLTEDIEE